MKRNASKNTNDAIFDLKNSINFRKNDITKEITDSTVILIDGMSLITDCFFNHEMNLFHGGQYLHFVYLFERFIERLTDLTEHFFIVFFQETYIYYLKDKSLNLAITIILNHLSKIERLKEKLKFFDNFLSAKYQSFLDEEKPTFITLNELNKFNKLKLNKKEKDEIMKMYDIFLVRHIGNEISVLILNNMVIESNRLIAYYAQSSYKIVKKFQKILSDNYLKDFSQFMLKKQIKDDSKNSFLIEVSSKLREKIENLSKCKGDKFCIYCLSLLNCYFQKRLETSDHEFIRFAVLVILNFYLCECLDLRTRSIRLRRKKKIIDSNTKHLLNILKDSLALIIGSIKYDFIIFKQKSISDLFDGRIFCFTWLMMQTNKIDLFNILDDNFFSDIFNCFKFLSDSISQLQLREKKFIQIVNLGSDDPTREEMTAFLEEIFLKKFSLKEIESKFFKIKHKNLNLEINCIEHKYIENLIEKICDSKKILWKKESEIINADNFLAKNKWHDYFKPIISNIRNNIEGDLISNKIIKELNIYSMEYKKNNVKFSEYKEIVEDINSLMKKKEYLKMEKKLSIYSEMSQDDFIYLEKIFMVVKKLSKKSKFSLNDPKNFILLKLTKNLLSKLDNIWSNIRSNRFKKNLDQLLTLIIKILDFFEFKILNQKIIEYVNQNFKLNLTVLESSEHLNHNISEKRFQLTILDEILKQKRISIKDSRTKMFTPDEWQIDFLDAVDKQDSMLIVAPTSSGKTFASFYAMEQVLKKNDDSILIYVSPTKALANQTAFGVLKRFEGFNPNSPKKLCGVFSRDFRENLLDCKILVTVPHCLFILLLSFCHNKWPSNIRYIIFDEIHSLSGEKSTDIWEYLLLLINCPFIALRFFF